MIDKSLQLTVPGDSYIEPYSLQVCVSKSWSVSVSVSLCVCVCVCACAVMYVCMRLCMVE
jgi:hypothetical protein